jgi:hypothetical protein
MTKVVVSQPMFLPWIGLFEQVRMADVFVHYDDVQRPQGRSFVSRVQLPGSRGPVWLTAPIDRERSGTLISKTVLVASRSWRDEHLETIRHLYSRQPNFRPMFDLAREIYACPSQNLAEFNMQAMELIAGRIGVAPRFARSSNLEIEGVSTARLVQISARFGATEYITGHGALNYLNHEAFEPVGTEVRYMCYATRPWPQLSPEFTPYVTILDLLASVSFEAALAFFRSGTKSWRDFGDSDKAVILNEGAVA